MVAKNHENIRESMNNTDKNTTMINMFSNTLIQALTLVYIY